MSADASQRRALITGGTSGIGEAIAAALADDDCEVTVTGLTDEEVETFEAKRATISARRLDVTDAEAIGELAAGFDRLDVLVNCAGTIQRENREFEPSAFEQVVDVNLNGVMRMCAACRTRLTESNGCVLNIASMLSFFGSGGAPAYSASKGGIAQLTKSLAIAWAADGIRVNAIAPGWIETALTQPLVDDQQRRQEIINRTPMRRWGQPADVAGAAVFLCSPDAAFITGVILPVDGGYCIA